MEPCLLRGINLRSSLVHFGKLWHFSPLDLSVKARGNLYSHSKKVEALDCFLSHTWHTPGWKKVLTLSLRNGFNFGLVSYLITAMLIFLLQVVDFLPSIGDYRADLRFVDEPATADFGPWTIALGPVAFMGGLLLWPYLPYGKEENTFLDVVCIDQVDEDRKSKGIYGLGNFLSKSTRLTILWSPPQFFRKWCVYEIAAFIALNPTGEICFFPLFVEQACLVMHMVYTLQTLVTITLMLAVDSGQAATIFWAGPAGVIPFIAGIHKLRLCMREKHSLCNSLSSFDVNQAECREEKDKEYVHGAIREWFKSEDNFNSYVRSEFANIVAQTSKVKLPYKHAVFVSLPMLGVCFDMCAGFAKHGQLEVCVANAFVLVGGALTINPAIIHLTFALAERFADRHGSACGDFAFSMLIGTCLNFLSILNLGVLSLAFRTHPLVSLVLNLIMTLVVWRIWGRHASGFGTVSDEPELQSQVMSDLEKQTEESRNARDEIQCASQVIQHEEQRIVKDKVDVPPVEVTDAEPGNIYQLPTLLETPVVSTFCCGDAKETKKQAF
jgi:hypothetical protein